MGINFTLNLRRLRFFFILGFVVLIGQSSFAQGTRGTIRGTVTDPNGAVVANANVQLVDSQKGTVVRNATTNNEGVYQFVEIEPSNYFITITAAGLLICGSTTLHSK